MLFKKIVNTLLVDGMHCQKCVARITKSLMSVEGVKKVSIDLEKKSVSIISKNEIPSDKLRSAIESLGFTVL